MLPCDSVPSTVKLLVYAITNMTVYPDCLGRYQVGNNQTPFQIIDDDSPQGVNLDKKQLSLLVNSSHQSLSAELDTEQ